MAVLAIVCITLLGANNCVMAHLVAQDQPLQGAWSVSALKFMGKELHLLPGSDEIVRNMQVVCTKNKIEIRSGWVTFHGKYEIKKSGDTKEIDIRIEKNEVLHRGIYSVNKDTAKMCIDLSGEGKLPSDFESPVDSKIVVISLKRNRK